MVTIRHGYRGVTRLVKNRARAGGQSPHNFLILQSVGLLSMHQTCKHILQGLPYSFLISMRQTYNSMMQVLQNFARFLEHALLVGDLPRYEITDRTTTMRMTTPRVLIHMTVDTFQTCP